MSKQSLQKQGDNKENLIDADTCTFDRPLKPGEDIKIWIRQLCLTEADEQRITLGKWLNSSLINATQKLLKKKFANEKGLQDRVTVAKETSWKPVQGEFVQVLHVGKSHWLISSQQQALLSWYSPCLRQHEGCYYSRYKEPDSGYYALQGSRDNEVMVADLQINDTDCGLHALAMAYELCAGNDPTGITWEHEQLRPHLKRCLEREEIDPFPRKGQRPSGNVR